LDASNLIDTEKNDIDSIITLQFFLDGTNIVLPMALEQNSTLSSQDIFTCSNKDHQNDSDSKNELEYHFSQMKQELLKTYEQQPEAILLASHMYGNRCLHDHHDIETAKLWYEYAFEQSNDTGSCKEKENVDPLDRRTCRVQSPISSNEVQLQQQRPDNILQQNIYRINRLQRWYRDENPDVDENLLFEL
jgi:hypothetical protein